MNQEVSQILHFALGDVLVFFPEIFREMSSCFSDNFQGMNNQILFICIAQELLLRCGGNYAVNPAAPLENMSDKYFVTPRLIPAAGCRESCPVQ